MQDTEGDGHEAERVRRERDLYLRLLELDAHDEIEPFLRESLALVVDAIGARLGYLELSQHVEKPDSPRWSIAHGLSGEEIERIRSAISRGIIAEALATGQTIVTPSALLDPRFDTRESVRTRRIEAVLCAPIGVEPPRGVLYLQGRSGAGPFLEEKLAVADRFVRHLAPLAERLLTRQAAQLDPTTEFRSRLRAERLVGRSPALVALLRHVALVSPLEVDVLLTGDSGTGKSLVARIIHDSGPRARGPFIELNCAALPDTLIESELFGALQGAHSTATKRMDGKVHAAEGGTLFLDEVGELAVTAQAKLLHLIHSRQYYPLGAIRSANANVRIIAASNLDLRAAVAEKRFREDLLYRLEVLPLRVPSLAERREDIAELGRFFCAEVCVRHSLARVELSRAAVRACEAAEWPGNVRQLAHAIEAAAIRAAGERASFVEPSHVFPVSPGRGADGAARDLSFQERTRRFQAGMLREVLAQEDWNVVRTAERLDLARSHVYALIRVFGLKRGMV